MNDELLNNDINHEWRNYCLHLSNSLIQNNNILPNNKTISRILTQVQILFKKEPMMIQTVTPITICGDLHGQYEDLLTIFNKKGLPNKNNRYLFLGDYCDRGNKALEVLLLLFCYKIMYPDDVILLRGNHETEDVSRIYGFFDECKRRTCIKIWKEFQNVFDYMSCAATIGNKLEYPLIFACHGGISRHLRFISEINELKKPTKIADEGLLCDLLWSDPHSEHESSLDWAESDRGISYTFSKNVLQNFLKLNNLQLVVRAHQVVEDGYEFLGNRKLVTIFSASHYCGEFDNKGGMMTIDKNNHCSFTIYD